MNLLVRLLLLSSLAAGITNRKEKWKEICDTEEQATLCRQHEVADFCGLYDYCASHGLFKRGTLPSDPVKITVYYESRCPYSIFFLMRNLAPAFKELHHTGLLEIELIPYGFTLKEGSIAKTTYTCQHGPAECHGNRLHACAIHFLNCTDCVPFVGCLAPKGSTDQAARLCANGTLDELQKIIDCANGDQGKRLMDEMGNKTATLQPPFATLPWVMFNGVYSEQLYESAKNDTMKVICDHYEGELPEECNERN